MSLPIRMLCFAGALGISTIVGYGQNVEPPKIVPPSPNGAAFAKYGTTPVSAYTGVPQITVPLYTVKFKDITIPITLSYHASGIRVAEEASQIGLGWVLNAGGVITRTIMNRDDFAEQAGAYLNPTNPVKQPLLLPSQVPDGWAQAGTNVHYISYVIYPEGTHDSYGQLDELYNYDIDFEPDQFQYNFINYSGKFALTKALHEGSPNWFSPLSVISKQEKIKFEPVNDTEHNELAASWNVTTSDGTVYIFAAKEKFLDPNYIDDTAEHISAWFLSTIISPTGATVQFVYGNLPDSRLYPTDSRFQQVEVNTANYDLGDFTCGVFACPQREYADKQVKGRNYRNIFLKQIIWANGRIEFTDSSRPDLKGDRRISAMSIYGVGTTDPTQVIEFDNSDYFSSTSGGPNAEFFTDYPVEAKKRLKLKGVRKYPFGSHDPDQAKETYSFAYYEGEGLSADNLPPKNSFSIDHWGYSNGRGNTSFVPNNDRINLFVGNLKEAAGVMGPQRDPCKANMRAFSLKEIKYPTKGRTTFSYEPNEYEVLPDNGQTYSLATQTYKEKKQFMYPVNNGAVLDISDEFITATGNLVQVAVDGTFRFNFGANLNCGSISQSDMTDVFFELAEENNPNNTKRVTLSTLTNCSEPDASTKSNCRYCEGQVYKYKTQIYLAPGRYVWQANIPSGNQIWIDVVANYEYVVDATKRVQSDGCSTPDNVGQGKRFYALGGGLRIQKIEDTFENGTINVRTFNYRDTVVNGNVTELHSTGKLMVLPRYWYYNITKEKIDGFTCPTCVHLAITGNSVISPNGPPVTYSKVIENFGSGGEFGRIEHEFVNEREDVLNYGLLLSHDANQVLIWPKPPTISTQVNNTNGMLLSQKIFAGENKTREIVNLVDEKYKDDLYGLEKRWWLDPAGSLGQTPSDVLIFLYPSVHSTFPFIKKTTETNYDLFGSATYSVVTDFEYGAHLQLSKKTTTESNDHKTIVTTKYPGDYPDPTPNNISDQRIVDKMTDRFMHGLPVEIQVTDEAPDSEGTASRPKKALKEMIVNVYDEFDNAANSEHKFLYLKESAELRKLSTMKDATSDIYSYTPGTTLGSHLRTVFELDYDNSGNMKSIHKESDMVVAYLWGYNDSYVIAEVKAAASNQVFHTSFESDGVVFTDAAGVNKAKTGSMVHNGSGFTFPAGFSPGTGGLMSYWYYDSKWKYSGIIPFNNAITTTGTKVDEVRAFPKGSQMTTFTYDPLLGQTSQSDPNGNTTYFEYDKLGRLSLTRDADGNITKRYTYHYKVGN